MSEGPLGPEKLPGHVKNSSALVRMPNGEFVSVDDLLTLERDLAAVEFPLSALREGDLVTALWEDGDYKPGSFSFRLKHGEWTSLMMGSGAPTPTWEVEIENGISGIKGSVSARFIGSGFGGSMISPNVLMSNRSLVFGLEDGREWRTNFVQSLKVLRKEGDNYSVLKVPEAGERNPQIDLLHNARQKQFESLMERFDFSSFDFRDCSKSSDGFVKFEDNRFVGEFIASMAQGNTLALFDKAKDRWISYRYYNWKGEDILQMAYADVDHDRFRKESGFNGRPYFSLGTSAVHRARGWLATYTTGPVQGLDALSYHVSESDAQTLLSVPPVGTMSPAPTLELVGTEGLHIARQYPMSVALKEHPGLLERLLENISCERTEQGGAILTLNKAIRKVLSPSEVFSALSTES